MTQSWKKEVKLFEFDFLKREVLADKRCFQQKEIIWEFLLFHFRKRWETSSLKNECQSISPTRYIFQQKIPCRQNTRLLKVGFYKRPIWSRIHREGTNVPCTFSMNIYIYINLPNFVSTKKRTISSSSPWPIKITIDGPSRLVVWLRPSMLESRSGLAVPRFQKKTAGSVLGWVFVWTIRTFWQYLRLNHSMLAETT